MFNNKENTILIVDDNPINLSVLFDHLHEYGFKVLVSEDGNHALEQVKFAKPDLILLDVMMPGLDGFETCRLLKENEEARDIPVIFMTALSETVDKIKGFKLGAVDYVTKPVQADELLARVNTHLTISNLRDNLQVQVAELDAFAHTVAHDLKNPLGVIVGYADYMLDRFSNFKEEEILAMLQKVSKIGHKSVTIIDELLTLAMVRKREVILETVDMAEVIVQAQQRIAPMLESHQGTITLPDSWPNAIGYAPWLEEVWVNYLSNGLKYSGKQPHLELGADYACDNHKVRFWVRDNGVGIAPEVQDTLFVEFTRFDEIRARGHGLGLSIVQRIMDRLNGDTGVESEPGKGSLFFFSLPAANE